MTNRTVSGVGWGGGVGDRLTRLSEYTGEVPIQESLGSKKKEATRTRQAQGKQKSTNTYLTPCFSHNPRGRGLKPPVCKYQAVAQRKK